MRPASPALHLPEERARSKLMKEVDRLAKQPFGSAEGSGHPQLSGRVSGAAVGQVHDVTGQTWRRPGSILDRDHFGLEKVKERILEFLAVRQLSPDCQGEDPLPGGPSRRGQDLHRPVAWPRP